MAEEKAFKKIGTIFDDFKCNTNILNAKIEKVMCEECARKYWMPMPYQNYRVK